MLNHEKLVKSLKIALNQEIPQLEKVKKELIKLKCHEIPTIEITSPVIATVATDGGENRLILEPIKMQIIRVVDSDGKEYFEEFIPLSFDYEHVIKFFGKNNELLQWLVNEINVKWEDLFPQEAYYKANLMAMLRELLEWAAILCLVKEGGNRHIVVRDGLLRSIVISDFVFQELKKTLEKYCQETGNLLVGIAKRSRILNYLSLSISIQDNLPKGKCAYIEIPKEFEREAAPASYWMASRSMGNLYLARLTVHSPAIYPIEIPMWEQEKRDFIFQNLAADAEGSFPDPGYPFSLVKAHRLARIGGFEIQLMEKMLIDELRETNPLLADHVLRQMMLGKKLSIPIGDEELE